MPEIRVPPRKITQVLTLAVIFLVVASSAGQFSTYVLGHGWVFGLVNLFSLDREANIPTWFSATMLLACAGLLGVISIIHRREADRWWKYWYGLGLIFLYLAVDEASSIHELTIEPIRSNLEVGGLFHWAWVVPGMIVVAVLGVVYLKFILSLPRTISRLFMLAGAVFISGALGMEMLGGAWFEEFGRRNLGYVTFWTVEETLEMAGVVIFLYALLCYLELKMGRLRIAIGGQSTTEVPVPARASREDTLAGMA